MKLSMIRTILLLIITATLLTGCLYKTQESTSPRIISKEALRNVQGAIDQYYADHQLLPILNSDSSIHKYEKYRVDFQKLKRELYIENIPTSAFENGGNYYYIIQNEEVDPIIKGLNIHILQKVNDMQKAVDSFEQTNGKWPFGEPVSDGFYTLDYEQLSTKRPELISPFSGQTVDMMLHESGKIFINYASDIMQLIQAKGLSSLEQYDDLSELLVEHSDYVPVRSALYRYENNMPVAYLKTS